MNDANSIIKELALTLSDSEQLGGLLCPFCHGGDKKEKTFSLKRDFNQAIFNCHRATCGRKGYLIVGLQNMVVQAKKTTHVTPFTDAIRSLSPLPTNVKKMLSEKYYMFETDFARLDARWSNKLQRVVMPILSPDRTNLGATLRSYTEGVRPKSYKYINNFNVPAISFYRCLNTGWDKLVIVEDQVSAARGANTVSTVALLGTNVNLPSIKLMKDLRPKVVVICLDADAFPTALKIHERWSNFFDCKCKVVKPPKDLKDMTRLELQDFLRTQTES